MFNALVLDKKFILDNDPDNYKMDSLKKIGEGGEKGGDNPSLKNKLA